MSELIAFKHNSTMTIGIELELRLVNLQTFNLAMESSDFLRRLSEVNFHDEVKPEITQSMIEINSSVHSSYDSLFDEIRHIRDVIVSEASKTHIGICGGGTHPFQKWHEQRIFLTERFTSVSQQYGYLAKQFTVFGQHIHVACHNGDDALYLCHALAAYIPHFIALSAASPFSQGIDTAFDCSRLAAISAFPLSGTPPWILEWDAFQVYFANMLKLDVVQSMKDFYWDIRPKPEFGTIEIRVGDTPLTIDKACQLAAYAQLLSSWLLETRPPLSRDIYLTYLVNRFRTARYGLQAILIDPVNNRQSPIIEDIKNTCLQLEAHSHKLNSTHALNEIYATAESQNNGATWLRSRYADLHCLEDVVREQTEIWQHH